MVAAHGAHESAGYTSAVFLRNNNAFGMREAFKRKRSQQGDEDLDGYANYINVEQSVQDLLLWFASHGAAVPSDAWTYANILKKLNYYEAPEEKYRQGLENWLKK